MSPQPSPLRRRLPLQLVCNKNEVAVLAVLRVHICTQVLHVGITLGDMTMTKCICSYVCGGPQTGSSLFFFVLMYISKSGLRSIFGMPSPGSSTNDYIIYEQPYFFIKPPAAAWEGISLPSSQRVLEAKSNQGDGYNSRGDVKRRKEVRK